MRAWSAKRVLIVITGATFIGAFKCVGEAAGFYGNFAQARSSIPFGECLATHFPLVFGGSVLFFIWLTSPARRRN